MDGAHACIVNHIFKKSFADKEVVTEYLREFSDKELKASRKILEDAGIDQDVKATTGQVAQEILDYADKGKYELIGSVAQRVFATTKMPFLLVK